MSDTSIKQEQVGDLTEQIKSLQQRVRQLVNENEQLRQYCHAMQEKVSVIQSSLEIAEKKLAQRVHEVAALTAMVREEQVRSAELLGECVRERESASAEKQALELRLSEYQQISEDKERRFALMLAECQQVELDKEQQWGDERRELLRQIYQQEYDLERQARELGQLVREAVVRGNKSDAG